MQTYFSDFNADFTCKNCGRYISARTAVSGVVNRNHCPYCLHSRHVDLFKAGDRLCACKSLMAPIGLTLKKSRDKYAHKQGGELMLIHRCTACGVLSINRIAADDDPVNLESVFWAGSADKKAKDVCQHEDITLLQQAAYPLVKTRLYGKVVSERMNNAY
jgi:hypothetical protein